MGVLSGLGTIAFTFGDAMLPEIQVCQPSRRQCGGTLDAARGWRIRHAWEELLACSAVMRCLSNCNSWAAKPHLGSAHAVLLPPTLLRMLTLLCVATQAVVDAPVAKNMYKGVSLCYSVITSCYVTIGIIGYWSFGNQASVRCQACQSGFLAWHRSRAFT